MRPGEQLRFLARLAANPIHTGAVAPSGKALSSAMATQVDRTCEGQVLELGPGTGAVTAALIARGIASERITAIEFDPHFAAMVRARCPGIEVIEGDAFALPRLLGGRRGFAAIISSLPLLNFVPQTRKGFLDEVMSRLQPGAPFVQFSYGFSPPVEPPEGIAVMRAARILFNLPPARVWVYRRSCDKAP